MLALRFRGWPEAWPAGPLRVHGVLCFLCFSASAFSASAFSASAPPSEVKHVSPFTLPMLDRVVKVGQGSGPLPL